MKKNKILWIFILIILLIFVIVAVIYSKKISKENINKNINNDISNKNSGINNETNKETIKTTLNDGILYSLTKEKINSDIIIGDNYFDTQINDIMINYQDYLGKNIEIEGMYLDNNPYTFVGRYSTSNLCPYCSGGYSYLEYVWEGEKLELENIKSWIKIIGTIEKGNNETSNYQDYYYLKAINIEKMNNRGQETVKN